MSALRVSLRSGDSFLHGKYRLEKKLGEGGMSQVWAAIELHSGNLVAIKVLHEQTRNFALRFKQECRVYAKLRHPNIVPMYESGSDEKGVLYIAMDLLVGKTLRRILQVTPRLDFKPAAHVGIQLADACGYMHAKGVWHRDLKPENLMIGTQKGQKGHLWVVDFGIAKFARPEDQGLDTDELPDVGTLRYMAPEQCDIGRRREVDGRADIYAFGGIMYETITSHHHFIKEGEPTTAAQIMHGHLTAKVRPVRSYAPGCPEDVADLIERCLAKDPGDRPQTFDEVGDVIGAAVQRSSLPADNYVLRRLEERRREASRAKAFADVSDARGDSEEHARIPTAGDPHKRTTVPGRYPALELEQHVGAIDIRQGAERPHEPVEEARDGDGADTTGARAVRDTEPMPPGFEPAPTPLPFQPLPEPKIGKGQTTPMPSAATLAAQGWASDPAFSANATYAARVRALLAPADTGKGNTRRMPSAATALAHADRPAATAEPRVDSPTPATPITPLATVTPRGSVRRGLGASSRPVGRAIAVGAACALGFCTLLVAMRHRLSPAGQPSQPPAPAVAATPEPETPAPAPLESAGAPSPAPTSAAPSSTAETPAVSATATALAPPAHPAVVPTARTSPAPSASPVVSSQTKPGKPAESPIRPVSESPRPGPLFRSEADDSPAGRAAKPGEPH
jgi:eukaryotic-like serine/threonine-protein kinase